MNRNRSAGIGWVFACVVFLAIFGSLRASVPMGQAHGFLGITMDTSAAQGSAVIDRVTWGGAAQNAGLKPGDVIVAINGQKTPLAIDVIAAIKPSLAGDTLTLTIARDGKQRDIKVTLTGNPPTVGPLGEPWKKGDPSAVSQDQSVETLKLPDALAKTPLRSVSFIDAANGWIVGGAGVCLRTADGGKTWATLPMKAGANFRTVQFSADGTGWITGDGEPNSPPPRGHVEFTLPMYSATLYRTTDGGSTWSVGWVPTNFQLYAIAAWPDQVVLGTFGGDAHPDGSSIIMGTDLTPKSIQRTFRSLFAMAVPSKGRIIAVGTPVSVGFGGVGPTPLLTQTQCRAIISNDGGTTWDVSKGSDGNPFLRGVAACGDKIAVSVGDNGTLLRSEDAGESWTAITSPTRNSLNGVASDGNKTFLAVGKNGTVIVSDDQGKTWKLVDTGMKATLRGVCAAGKFFYVVGDGAALRIKPD